MDEAERSSLIPRLEKRVTDIQRWSTANDLKLNNDTNGVQICDTAIDPVNNPRNLGIIVENDLKMNSFVNNICRSASYALYRSGQITTFLDKKKSTEILIHAFITCHLDQCNNIVFFLWAT